MKNNLEYYRHQVNSHNHWKFKTLRRKYKWDGEGKFWALNNIIAESDYCILDLGDENKLFAIAAELDFSVEEFKEYIEYLTNSCRLICNEGGKISTKITQENLNKVEHKRERQRDWKKEKQASGSDLSPTKTEKSTAKEVEIDGEKQQSKVKESKVKNIEPKGSSETGVSKAEAALRAKYKEVADSQVKVKLFLTEDRPRFVEPYARYWNFWAETNGFPKVKTITDNRRKKIKVRCREEPFDFVKIVDEVQLSDFDRTRSWLTFDWILESEKNYTKVLEGNYRKKTGIVIQQASYLEKRKQDEEKLKAKINGG